MKLFLPFLYTLTLYGTFVAGSLQIRDKSSQTVNRPAFLKKTPWTTLIVAGLISAGLILQIILPQLLALCMRNRLLILKGELWRLITALFFQDGGLAGGISNIVGLLFIGSLAEQFWTPKEWLIIFFIGGILSEVAGFWWQPSGAGNSVANLCLAASVAFVCLNSHTSRSARVLAIFSLATVIPLLMVKDIHGAALVIGLFIAIVITWLDSNRQKNKSQ